MARHVLAAIHCRRLLRPLVRRLWLLGLLRVNGWLALREATGLIAAVRRRARAAVLRLERVTAAPLTLVGLGVSVRSIEACALLLP